MNATGVDGIPGSATIAPESGWRAWIAFDYGVLPPEINSGRLYAGPGSGPLLAAAGAWGGLAAELGVAASGYHFVISALTDLGWVGPTSAAMVAAVMPYVMWLSQMAARAEEAGMQAQAAAAAYESAFAMTVPPPLIAANRVRLAALVATNFFGQNAPAIAATEAEYAEFWAQDAIAMYCYASSSATASMLGSFTPPPRTTSSGGLSEQQAAVANAAMLARGGAQHAVMSAPAQPAALSGVVQALQQFGWSGVADGFGSKLSGLISGLPGLSTSSWNQLVNTSGLSYFGSGVVQLGYLFAQQLVPHFGKAPPVFPVEPDFPAEPGFASTVSPAGGRAVLASAQVGQAGRIGAMSVPPGWVVSPSAPGHGGSGLSVTVAHGSPTNATQGLLPAVRREYSGAAFARRRYGIRLTVMARPPDGG